MEDTAKNILSQVPAALPIGPVMEKYPVLYEQSMNTVLVQEVIRSVVGHRVGFPLNSISLPQCQLKVWPKAKVIHVKQGWIEDISKVGQYLEFCLSKRIG